MVNVIVDKLRYFATFDNNVLVEGYNGFKVEENIQGAQFVVYKDIIMGEENEKRFVLPRDTLKNFLKYSEQYKNFFERQRFIFKLLVAAESKLIVKDEAQLKDICNSLYTIPENYIHFVAMNMTKNQFFSCAKEKILNYSKSLELN